MKTKDQVAVLIGKFIKRKRGKRTLEEYGKLCNTKPKALHKHESGVLSVDVLIRHVSSKEEFAELYEYLKQ